MNMFDWVDLGIWYVFMIHSLTTNVVLSTFLSVLNCHIMHFATRMFDWVDLQIQYVSTKVSFIYLGITFFLKCIKLILCIWQQMCSIGIWGMFFIDD